MQTLDIHRPEMPDLQFALLVTALCTSRLTALNIPAALRTTIFDRCWVLMHDSPPPRRPEERVIDLRPWNEVTLDAIVETIRSVLTEAGIRTLTWDHPASDPTQTSTPEAQILINRLEHLYPHPSEARDRASGAVREDVPDRHIDGGSDVRHLVGEMAALIAALSPALKRRAGDLAAGGKDGEVVGKLLEGANVLRDSGYLYLTWARHYATLADNKAERAEETDGNELAGC
jgi:hypothetical protein